ncbi:hypothetical protein SIN01_25700 [Sporolactobacillus inulinus]|nr:hypothetical protein SIN01_25700 [Sporolactobacillus inulinus]
MHQGQLLAESLNESTLYERASANFLNIPWPAGPTIKLLCVATKCVELLDVKWNKNMAPLTENAPYETII